VVTLVSGTYRAAEPVSVVPRTAAVPAQRRRAALSRVELYTLDGRRVPVSGAAVLSAGAVVVRREVRADGSTAKQILRVAE
jgi:hypothetical protein